MDPELVPDGPVSDDEARARWRNAYIEGRQEALERLLSIEMLLKSQAPIVELNLLVTSMYQAMREAMDLGVEVNNIKDWDTLLGGLSPSERMLPGAELYGDGWLTCTALLRAIRDCDMVLKVGMLLTAQAEMLQKSTKRELAIDRTSQFVRDPVDERSEATVLPAPRLAAQWVTQMTMLNNKIANELQALDSPATELGCQANKALQLFRIHIADTQAAYGLDENSDIDRVIRETWHNLLKREDVPGFTQEIFNKRRVAAQGLWAYRVNLEIEAQLATIMDLLSDKDT